MNLLPIAKKVAASTIGSNLVNVKPMCGLTLEQEKEREREIRRRKLQVLMGNAKFDDFGDLPDAQTSSLIAAGYAVKNKGKIFVGNGMYSSYLPVTIKADSIDFSGQEKENVLLRNLHNHRNNPVFYLLGDGCTVDNFSLLCGDKNYYALESLGDDHVFEHIHVKALDGFPKVAGGIKARGDNLIFRNIFLDNSLWGMEIGSPGGIVEDCHLITDRDAISLNGENTVVRNNIIEIKLLNRAIAMQSSYNGMGNQIIEKNQITLYSDYTINSHGIIYLSRASGPGNTNESIIRNNTVYSKVTNPFISINVNGDPNSGDVIVENNRFYCSYTKGGQAMFLNAGNSNGSPGIILRNNIFRGLTSRDAINISGAECIGDEKYFAICNNNFQMAPGAEQNTDHQFIRTRLFHYSYTDTSNTYIVNNIFEGNGYSYFIGLQDDYYLYSDYNIVYNFSKYKGDKGEIIGNVNDIYDDPLYIDDELRTDDSSPSVDNGASPTEYEFIYNRDILDTLRPQGAKYDIGAYEK